jgi:Predicted membrane protein (DUF2232)
MPHPFGLAVLCGLLSAVLFLSLLLGLPGMLLVYFAQLPVLFAGLALGLTGSGIAAIGAIVVIGLVVSMAAALGYALLHALPALFTVRQALLRRTDQGGKTECFPVGLLLTQLTVLAGAGVVLAFLLLGSEPGGLPGFIEEHLRTGLSELGLLDEATEPSPDLARLAAVIPGFTASSSLLMVMINFMLAQLLAVRAGWARRPTPDFDRLELPGWLWPGIAAAALLVLAGGVIGDLGWSLLIVLVVPYLFLGLALVHVVVRRWSRPGLALGAIYGAMILLGWPILLVLLLGFVEDWAHLRRRWR